MAKKHKRVTPEGEQLGRESARLIAPAIERLIAEGEPDERCASCAFRLGTVPNGCVQTQMDAIKAAIEGVEFRCHVGDKPICHGWYAARVALNGRVGRLPYDFSPNDDGTPFEPERLPVTAPQTVPTEDQ